MGFLRLLLVTLVTWGLCFWLLRAVALGLHTGAISHSDTSSRVARLEKPVGYWLLVAGFSAGGLVAWSCGSASSWTS